MLMQYCTNLCFTGVGVRYERRSYVVRRLYEPVPLVETDVLTCRMSDGGTLATWCDVCTNDATMIVMATCLLVDVRNLLLVHYIRF